MSTTTPVRRGTSNSNDRGNVHDRRRRREWLVSVYRANVDLAVVVLPIVGQVLREVPLGTGQPACRCYRCGDLLTVETVTADRIKPHAEGGKYGTPLRDAREGRTNIRPACLDCQSETGGALGAQRLAQRRLKAVPTQPPGG